MLDYIVELMTCALVQTGGQSARLKLLASNSPKIYCQQVEFSETMDKINVIKQVTNIRSNVYSVSKRNGIISQTSVGYTVQ